ncbi:hypothetical protein HID58_067833 [Brassica napus]|uniref:Secreted protein n=1 Tax=Brassica napus TaxID=3708 RepID=A0ABQ7ZJM6_BRANA|nr:hypothetical protein HID58_067833 [Brassica napus]
MPKGHNNVFLGFPKFLLLLVFLQLKVCVDICDFLHFGALHDCKSVMVFAAVGLPWYLQSGHFKQNPPTLVLPF